MARTSRTPAASRYELVTEEKAGGATYTPKRLADFVAAQIVDAASLSDKSARIRVLDPAVGNGELLVSLLGRLGARTGHPVSVYGFETDDRALIEARRRLERLYPETEIHLHQGDFLEFVLARDTLFESPLPKSYDLLIANPPYVRTQILGSRQAQELAGRFGLTGRVDLYYAFLAGMAEVLRPGGVAGVIVSNRFMTTRSGASVRRIVRERFRIRHVWDLGDTKLFEVAVLPAVLLLEGRNGPPIPEAAFTSIYETRAAPGRRVSDPIEALPHEGVVETDDGRSFLVRQGSLAPCEEPTELWRIATPESDAWLATVALHSWGTFREIGKVRVGVKTCGDRVFIRSDWDSLPADQRPELLRRLTTHHVARRFKALEPETPRKILYPHCVVEGRRSPVELSRYPRSLAYLETHRSVLESRKYLIEAGRRWYEAWVPQDPEAWPAPKLVFRDISRKPTFWIDLEGTVVNGDCYWLVAEDRKEDLLWLAAAVANSTFIETFYDHRFHNKLYAGRRRFITQYVEQFPLPDPASERAREIMVLAREAYRLAGTAEGEVLEKRIDRLVWQAFGLRIEEGAVEEV